MRIAARSRHGGSDVPRRSSTTSPTSRATHGRALPTRCSPDGRSQTCSRTGRARRLRGRSRQGSPLSPAFCPTTGAGARRELGCSRTCPGGGRSTYERPSRARRPRPRARGDPARGLRHRSVHAPRACVREARRRGGRRADEQLGARPPRPARAIRALAADRGRDGRDAPARGHLADRRARLRLVPARRRHRRRGLQPVRRSRARRPQAIRLHRARRRRPATRPSRGRGGRPALDGPLRARRRERASKGGLRRDCRVHGVSLCVAPGPVRAVGGEPRTPLPRVAAQGEGGGAARRRGRMTRDPLQRPQHFVPGLRAAPWWDPDELPIVDELERRFPDILEEFHDFVFAGSLMLHPQSAGGPRKQLTTGDWNIVDLWSNGSLNPRNAIRAPVTAALLAADDDVVTGESTLAYFSVVAPHSHVEPHCGPTNARIRIHLGIRTPEGGRIRVGRETRSWQEGRCLVFDDSFEHEVWNDADVPRSVLLVDVAHPDLPRRRRRATAARNGADSIREGWARDGARHTPESELASLAAAEFRSVFALVGPDRAAAVQSAVAKVDDEIPLLRAAASCLEARAVSGRAYARPWAVLSEAADHGAF